MNVNHCLELIERDRKVIAPCQHLTYFPLAVDSANGSLLTDEDGNTYIDFLSSASSLNLGSRNAIVHQAMQEQMEKFVQYTPLYCYNRREIEYAERLTSVYPGGIDAKVCFGNSGSDANDAAIKFARAYTGRRHIITFLRGYHGNTYGAATLSNCTFKMKEKMGPFLPCVHAFPFYGMDQPDDVVEKACLYQMEEAFESYLPVHEVAAIIIEPMQGDGGLLAAHPIFMRKLYDLCRKNGILFIVEEVQQGFFRTGKWFSIEHYDGIIPDGIIMGKSVGGGLTLGAFMGRAEMMDALPAPAHVFTLGGNALACSAGIAAFDYYKTDEFQTLLRANIELAEKEAAKLKERHPSTVGFVRNLGLSMGIGIQHPDGSPDRDGTFKILFRSFQKGLIVISLAGNVLRIQPPLNIEPELLTKGFHILDEAMEDYENDRVEDEVLRYRAGW